MMRLKVRISKKWIALIILALLVTAYLIIDSAIRPTILSLSESELRAVAVKAMNDAVRETIGDSGVTYSDLTHIEKDETGKISLISVNTTLVNELGAETALAAQDKIMNAGEQGIFIPIGTILGGQILTGRGPSVVIKFEPVGSVTTELKTQFEEAGINQTRHKIFLILTASVRIMIGSVSQTVSISTQVLISDTIIIGDVPRSYFENNNGGLLNLLPGGEM
jgi:sporulation protein YunB